MESEKKLSKVCTRYNRKIIGGWKDIENNFYTIGSLNIDLEWKFKKNSLETSNRQQES
jgi:hypothetical protein